MMGNGHNFMDGRWNNTHTHPHAECRGQKSGFEGGEVRSTGMDGVSMWGWMTGCRPNQWNRRKQQKGGGLISKPAKEEFHLAFSEMYFLPACAFTFSSAFLLFARMFFLPSLFLQRKKFQFQRNATSNGINRKKAKLSVTVWRRGFLLRWPGCIMVDHVWLMGF